MKEATLLPQNPKQTLFLQPFCFQRNWDIEVTETNPFYTNISNISCLLPIHNHGQVMGKDFFFFLSGKLILISFSSFSPTLYTLQGPNLLLHPWRNSFPYTARLKTTNSFPIYPTVTLAKVFFEDAFSHSSSFNPVTLSLLDKFRKQTPETYIRV